MFGRSRSEAVVLEKNAGFHVYVITGIAVWSKREKAKFNG
jgi:hypothetical protein